MGKGDLFVRAKVLCPECTGLLLENKSGGCIRCSSCNAGYPHEGSLIDLIPGRKTANTLPQHAMEFAPIVSIYESTLWRKNPLITLFMGITFEREYAAMTGALELEKDDIVLDLACGTGIYGRRVATSLPGGMVVGLDLSLPMLSRAREDYEELGLSNYLLIHEDATKIPLVDESIDAVLCGGALHLFPDLKASVREVYRVLKPGGRFAVSAFCPGDGLFSAWISSIVHMMKGIRGITPEGLEGIFSETGFKESVCRHAQGFWLIMSAAK